MEQRKTSTCFRPGLMSDRSIKEKSACHSHRAFVEVSQRSAAGGSPEHPYMGINSSQPPGDLGTADPAYPATIMMFANFTGPIMVLMIAVTMAPLAHRCSPQNRRALPEMFRSKAHIRNIKLLKAHDL